MQKSIIVSLSLALFILAARLLWDQKDVFLISYWGRLHPEVQLYGLQLINMFCMYLTSNTRWSQLFMDIEQKTRQKWNLSSHTYTEYSDFHCSWTNPSTKFNITVPIFIAMDFFVFKLIVVIKKAKKKKIKHLCPFRMNGLNALKKKEIAGVRMPDLPYPCTSMSSCLNPCWFCHTADL